MKNKLFVLILIILAIYIRPVYAEEIYKIKLTLDHIHDVSPTHLEGWIITGDDKISFGKFSVDDMMMGMMIASLPSGLVVVSQDTMSLSNMIEDLKTQVSGLESEISDLENENMILEATIMELDVEVSMVPLGSWQMVSALVIGIAIGAVIIYMRK